MAFDGDRLAWSLIGASSPWNRRSALWSWPVSLLQCKILEASEQTLVHAALQARPELGHAVSTRDPRCRLCLGTAGSPAVRQSARRNDLRLQRPPKTAARHKAPEAGARESA